MAIEPDAYNARELAAKRLLPHHVSALVALWQERHQIEVDGKCGPHTRRSIETEIGDTPAADTVSEPPDQREDWPPFEGPLAFIPSSRREVYDLLGDPGPKAKPDKRWRKENVITVRDLPGVPPRWFFEVHRLVEPYVREALRRASSASTYQIERAACFVHRHIRHDHTRPLSLHSWAMAVDFDPARNAARTVTRGQAPIPFSEDWTKIWPNGVDQAFVEAFESVGFTWGGVWGHHGGDLASRASRASYLDPMHFELRARR